jgi:hypothetical protein
MLTIDRFKIDLCDATGKKKPQLEQIQILTNQMEALDKEISNFRKTVLTPTKPEHRYFVGLKDLRKKSSMEKRRIRRLMRREKDQALHEQLNIMTKAEMKAWRVISHKHFNIEQNLENIESKITDLKEFSKFTGLLERVIEETKIFKEKVQAYRTAIDEVENIITKHYYRDKQIADEARSKTSSETSERDQPQADMVKSELIGDNKSVEQISTP